MIELIFYNDLNFWGTTKNNSWLYNKQRNNQKKKNQRDLQLHDFPQILKEKKHNDLFWKSKKSLLRDTKSDNLFIIFLGVRWIARLAFIRCVNRHAHAFYWQACVCDLLLAYSIPCRCSCMCVWWLTLNAMDCLEFLLKSCRVWILSFPK